MLARSWVAPPQRNSRTVGMSNDFDGTLRRTENHRCPENQTVTTAHPPLLPCREDRHRCSTSAVVVSSVERDCTLSCESGSPFFRSSQLMKLVSWFHGISLCGLVLFSVGAASEVADAPDRQPDRFPAVEGWKP